MLNMWLSALCMLESCATYYSIAYDYLILVPCLCIDVTHDYYFLCVFYSVRYVNFIFFAMQKTPL